VLIDAYDYIHSDIIVLQEYDNDPTKIPTRENILTHLNNIINESETLTEIWIHYSGHGTQIKDVVGDKESGFDDVIVPCDFQINGFILDDEIFNIIKNTKCKTLLVFDCCHSGSMCELQWSFEYTDNQLQKTEVSHKIIENPNVFSISGCKDSQTSEDSFNYEHRQPVGAFSDTFIQCLRNHRHNIDIITLFTSICELLIQNGYSQNPVLSCSSDNPQHTFVRALPVSL